VWRVSASGGAHALLSGSSCEPGNRRGLREASVGSRGLWEGGGARGVPRSAVQLRGVRARFLPAGGSFQVAAEWRGGGCGAL
jgi:hypothetical protein